ncbi:hypothetical protein FY034_14005 [Trichlorobacter lovleyi]|nr:hypothetical protein [Trichlorobacter lovleyi]QOX80001.1 hypothetical protein FY034_14005 [Trichlorobacter lovleyi]
MKQLEKQYVVRDAALFAASLALIGALFAVKQVRFAGRWHELYIFTRVAL